MDLKPFPTLIMNPILIALIYLLKYILIKTFHWNIISKYN